MKNQLSTLSALLHYLIMVRRSLAVSHCQSGLSLDITRGLEIWAYIQLKNQVFNLKI